MPILTKHSHVTDCIDASRIRVQTCVDMDEPRDRMVDGRRMPAKKYACHICGVPGFGGAGMSSHFRKTHGMTSKEAFEALELLKSGDHPGAKTKRLCPMCGELDTRPNLYKHLVKVHGKTPDEARELAGKVRSPARALLDIARLREDIGFLKAHARKGPRSMQALAKAGIEELEERLEQETKRLISDEPD